jgi:hypothetical protein
MGLRVVVHDDVVDVTIDGGDALLCLSKGVQLRMDQITSARVAPWTEARADMGWRVGGGYFPGWFATGWYTIPGRTGARQLWCTYRDPEVLIIDTTLERPARLVLQHPDRHDLAWWISERLGAT